ncbi:MAG: ISAzo13 family transposase, partial [Armatimonadetes bacterium]|nr:ISAzo13 family transposase [Armatimonadota bacterium]
GLKVHAMLDEAEYPTKIRVTDAEMETIPLKRHRFHGEWNYTVDPS